MVRTRSMKGNWDQRIYYLAGVLAIIMLAAFPEIYQWFLPIHFLFISIICFIRYKTKSEKVVAFVSLLLAIGSMILFFLLKGQNTAK